MAHDIFEKSYLNFLKLKDQRCDEENLKYPQFIEEILSKGRLVGAGLEEPVGTAFDRSVSIILAEFYHYILPNLGHCFSKAESPIEQLFFLAMVTTGIKEQSNIFMRRMHSGGEHLEEIVSPFEKDSDVLIVNNQVNIGEYRVDFLLEFQSDVPDFSNTVKLADGKEIPGNMRGIAKLIVECDGHDFHEKTKEQARKDKSRDRVLQSVGYDIFHFTGSEIYKDCFGCAQQCYHFLYNKVWGNT